MSPAERVEVRLARLPHGADLPLPAYQSAGAAGMDLFAAVGRHATVMLAPGARTAIPTGIAIALPAGYEAELRPRSGLAQGHGITLLNAPGTIDSDYRGEVMVLLVNHGSVPYEIARGERVAQLVVRPVTRAVLIEVAELGPTPRGAGGFGSTGRGASGG